MWLRNLKIENFRSIGSLELDFGTEETPRQWTYLLGENGTGKSNILRAIALVLSEPEAFWELTQTPDDWIKNEKQELILEATGEWKTGEAKQGATRQIHLQRGQSISETIHKMQFPSEWREAFRVGYGASRRLTSNISLQSSSRFSYPTSQHVATLFTNDSVLNPLESWAMEIDYRYPQNGLATIKEELAGLLPGVEFSHIDKAKKQLIFTTSDGDVPLNQLSDGFQNMLSWVGDLLSLLHKYSFLHLNIKEVRGILLLDEMELHLHPKWQHALRAYLESALPNFQFIVTTHSPLTALQAQEGELYYLEREHSGTAPQLRKYRGNPSNLMIHQMLNSPAFGHQTLDSHEVSRKRSEYQRLRTKSVLSSEERMKKQELEGEFSALPTTSMQSEDDESLISLLRKVRQSL